MQHYWRKTKTIPTDGSEFLARLRIGEPTGLGCIYIVVNARWSEENQNFLTPTNDSVYWPIVGWYPMPTDRKPKGEG